MAQNLTIHTTSPLVLLKVSKELISLPTCWKWRHNRIALQWQSMIAFHCKGCSGLNSSIFFPLVTYTEGQMIQNVTSIFLKTFRDQYMTCNKNPKFQSIWQCHQLEIYVGNNSSPLFLHSSLFHFFEYCWTALYISRLGYGISRQHIATTLYSFGQGRGRIG